MDLSGHGTSEPCAGGPADATVHAADLLLLLYSRQDRAVDGFDLSGYQDLIDRWCAHPQF